MGRNRERLPGFFEQAAVLPILDVQVVHNLKHIRRLIGTNAGKGSSSVILPFFTMM